MQLQSQHDKLRRVTRAGVGLEVRPGGPSQGGQEHAVSSAPKRNFAPDQGLIDSYRELLLDHAELRREIQLLRAGVESVIRHIDDFWQGDDSTKALVIEQLRTALSSKLSSET